jgi:hypothetical protein
VTNERIWQRHQRTGGGGLAGSLLLDGRNDTRKLGDGVRECLLADLLGG